MDHESASISLSNSGKVGDPLSLSSGSMHMRVTRHEEFRLKHSRSKLEAGQPGVASVVVDQ